jgi:hypothetical protein
MDMDMDLTSLDGLYGRMDMDIGRANPIRKGVAAKRPILPFQGVVAAIHRVAITLKFRVNSL